MSDQNERQSPPLPVKADANTTYGFELDDGLASLFPVNEARAKLKAEILRDRRIRDKLLVAVLPDGKRVLYDGYTRLSVWEELRREGNDDIPMPEVEVKEFGSMAEVYLAAVQTQDARRNARPQDLAAAAVMAAEMEAGTKYPNRERGKPRKGEPKFPSAKALSKKSGVSDWAIRTYLNARKVPTILNALMDRKEGEAIDLRTAERRLSDGTRRATYEHRENLLDQQRKMAGDMDPMEVPEAIEPDGIYCVDFKDGMKRVEAETVSLIAGSMPYPVLGVKYPNYAYDGDYPKWLDQFIRPVFAEGSRVLRRGGRIALNFDICANVLPDEGTGETAEDEDKARRDIQLDIWTDISSIARREFGYLFMGHKHWYRQNAPGKFAAKGSYGSCRSPRGNPLGEFVLIFAKEVNYLDGDPAKDDITTKEYDKFVLSDWYIKPEVRRDDNAEEFHSAPYPEELPYRLIKLLTYRDDVVLDPWNGSGTTAFVALATGRRFIGLDNCPVYCEQAIKRLAKLDGLAPEEMVSRVKRFLPSTQKDGRESHRVQKPEQAPQARKGMPKDAA